MGDLSLNLKANLKRYTTKKNRAEYIAKIAAYTTLSYILYVVCKFPLPFIFPSFLDIQISEIPALIAGFSMGPISGCLVIVLKCLLKLPITGTFMVGEFTDILLGICFVLPSSLIYNAKKNKKRALISLIVGALCSTITAIIVNRFISIPFYIEVMFKGNEQILLNMVSNLYQNVTMDNFYKWYLLAGILPFNLLRCIIVSIVTFILYPRLKKPLRLETVPQTTESQSSNFSESETTLSQVNDFSNDETFEQNDKLAS